MTTAASTHTPAEQLAQRLRAETVDSLRSSHADAYAVGVNAAASSLSSEQLRDLDRHFEDSLEGVAVHTLDEDVVWNLLVEAIGDADEARALLAEKPGAALSSVAELAAFVLGAVHTWREAESLL